eukprot:3830137-Pleurochrysis_carterae.AAC.1
MCPTFLPASTPEMTAELARLPRKGPMMYELLKIEHSTKWQNACKTGHRLLLVRLTESYNQSRMRHGYIAYWFRTP